MHGDNKRSYKLARNLSKYNPAAIKTVHDEHGAPTKSPEEYDSRWLEHFQNVFDATIVADFGEVKVEEAAEAFHDLHPCSYRSQRVGSICLAAFKAGRSRRYPGRVFLSCWPTIPEFVL